MGGFRLLRCVSESVCRASRDNRPRIFLEFSIVVRWWCRVLDRPLLGGMLAFRLEASVGWVVLLGW